MKREFGRGLMIAWVAALAVVVMVTSALGQGGILSGVVEFAGGKAAAPPRMKINMGNNPACAAARGGKGAGTENLIVNKDGTLRNVIVYVKKGLEGQKFAVPATPVVLDQVGCMYRPHVIALMTGQTLTIKNSDATMHNINAQCRKNQPFNIGQAKQGMTRDKTFPVTETFKVMCNVHPWMNAYIMVLPHPKHDVTGKDGVFFLGELPEGEYVIGAWHEQLGEQERKIKIEKGGIKEIEFVFELKE